MELAGILPEDAPDPRAEWVERLKLMPIPVTGRMVNAQAGTVINGVDVPGAEVDTDVYVCGIGPQLAGGGVVTAVLPRTELKHIQVQFTTRDQPPRTRLCPAQGSG